MGRQRWGSLISVSARKRQDLGQTMKPKKSQEHKVKDNSRKMVISYALLYLKSLISTDLYTVVILGDWHSSNHSQKSKKSWTEVSKLLLPMMPWTHGPPSSIAPVQAIPWEKDCHCPVRSSGEESCMSLTQGQMIKSYYTAHYYDWEEHLRERQCASVTGNAGSTVVTAVNELSPHQLLNTS